VKRLKAAGSNRKYMVTHSGTMISRVSRVYLTAAVMTSPPMSGTASRLEGYAGWYSYGVIAATVFSF
jgi:hypothetical protein